MQLGVLFIQVIQLKEIHQTSLIRTELRFRQEIIHPVILQDCQNIRLFSVPLPNLFIALSFSPVVLARLELEIFYATGVHLKPI